MKISFVIPVYNRFDLLNDLLISLFQYQAPDEVIAVDDASPDEDVYKGLKWWKENYGIKVIEKGRNSGFLKTSNLGLRSATGDIVCLLSTDVMIETNLQIILRSIFIKDENVLVGGIVYNGSTGWNQFGQRIFPYAEGWLLACTKKSWERLGYFDERFAPNDFEDVDLSTKAIRNGLKLYSLNDPHVRHIGAQSIGYNEQREEITRRNMKIFEEKWITKNSHSE